MNCDDVKQKAKQAGYNFLIVCPNDPGYNDDRKIANSRFNLCPDAIVYCEEENHVAWCIAYCRDSGTDLRIRSGGHQHEGMCSADGVLMIDLSKMNTIEYVGDRSEQAWIPPGKQLKDVYTDLENKNRIIPGGGCGSVCVGGLTQGGGWGPSARKFGLTCDNIIEAKVVLANGKIVCATLDNEYSDLFWAIKGGGGGNFGVVTNFLFQLYTLKGQVTTFELHWSKDQMLAISKKWMQEFSCLDNDLTSFCRLTVIDKETQDKPAVLLGGQFYGNIQVLMEVLKPLYDVAHPAYEKYVSIDYKEKPQTKQLRFSEFEMKTPLADSHLYFGSLMQPGPPNAPTETCDAPHPHKISSTFPKNNDYENLAKEIVDFIQNSEASEEVNKYLSLHGMGGAIKNVSDTGSAFPYRNKDFMLQFQAWWSKPEDLKTNQYVSWIKDFREKLNPYTEGSFINFPDKDLVSDPDKQRIELLEYYYSINLQELRKIKTQYDPNNLFSFGMSIPVLPE